MIKKILVATDGSESAQKAVKYSLGLAKQTGAAVVLLSVIDKEALVAQYVPAGLSPTHLVQPIEQFIQSAAQAYLVKAEKECRKKRIRCSSVVRKGHPVEEILREAKKSKADILVVGCQGRGALESAVLGSVAYGLIHKNAKYPVLVVRK